MSRTIVARVKSRFGGPLGSQSFRRLVGGKAVSYFGDWLVLAGLVGWIYHVTGSTGSVSALMVVRLLPPIVGGGFAASLLDRFPRERALLVGQLASATAVAVALAGVLRGSEVVVFAAAAAFGFLSPIGYSAASALVPRVVAEGQLAPANAVLAMAQETAMAGGALAAGVTVSAGTAAGALALALGAYTFAAASYARIRPQPSAAAGAAERKRAGLVGGLRYLRGRRTLVVVLGAFALVTLATGLTNATLPRFLGGLGLGAGAYGFGIGALALGFVVGEGAVGVVASRVGPRALGLAIAAMAPLFAALALASHAAAALAALVAIGCVEGVTEVVLPTIVQQEAAPEYHGRLFALASTGFRTTMVGAFAAAPLVNRLGPPRDAILVSALVLAGAAALVFAAAGTSSRAVSRADASA